MATTDETLRPYSLPQLLGLWAAVSIPMGLLAWVVAPFLQDRLPIHPGITFWALIIVGMTWQFVLSLIVLYRELGTLRWSAVRARIWARGPRDPHTGDVRRRLW